MVQPVILMRPGEANNRLAAVLEKSGIKVWRWPAFVIRLPVEEEAVAARLSNLDDVEMVVLPSPMSVAAAAHWIKKWPAHVTLATVGEGTARAIRACWGDDVNLLYPQGDAAHSGSEALWSLVCERGAPSRVLFLRGQTGREWLPEQFRSIGSDVVVLSTYVREPLELTQDSLGLLSRVVGGCPPVIYITSSDAVEVLMHAVRPVAGAREWIAKGWALTIHPRVVERLREAGFANVEVTSAEDAVVSQRIIEILEENKSRGFY